MRFTKFNITAARGVIINPAARRGRRALLFLVCLALIFTYPIQIVYGNSEQFFASNPNMRIGLVFGSGMTESFQTTSEDGFLFGYVEYNASDKFNVLSYSANTKIRVTRNAANNAAIVIDPDTDEILFQYLDSDNNFATVAATESNKNLTNGQSITELSAQNTGFTTTPAGNIYSGAFIYRTEGGGVEVINLVSLEDYIKGVLPYEISPNWPEEAQKAFSIAVRSYSVRSINRHASAGFMLCNTTHCQVYRGGINATAGTNAAVDATKDLVAVFNNQVIEAVYHSSSGGVTENNSDAWGTARVAYLASVTVPHERYNTPNRANSLWTNTVSPQELYEYLVGTSPQASRFRGTLDSAIANIIINERSPSSNYIKSVTVTDRNGNSVTGRIQIPFEAHFQNTRTVQTWIYTDRLYSGVLSERERAIITP